MISMCDCERVAASGARSSVTGNLRTGIDGCRLLHWTEPEYPQNLLQIYDPPVLLYVRGDAQILNAPTISIVGT